MKKEINVIWNTYSNCLAIIGAGYLILMLIFGGEFSMKINWDSWQNIYHKTYIQNSASDAAIKFKKDSLRNKDDTIVSKMQPIMDSVMLYNNSDQSKFIQFNREYQLKIDSDNAITLQQEMLDYMKTSKNVESKFDSLGKKFDRQQKEEIVLIDSAQKYNKLNNKKLFDDWYFKVQEMKIWLDCSYKQRILILRFCK